MAVAVDTIADAERGSRAERPGRHGRSAGFLRRHRVPLIATATMLPLYVVWAFFRANGGGDLAAQDTWARFAAEHGDSAYGLFWFGGLHTANYSLLSPYLMGFFGVRTIGVASGLAAGWLAAVLFVRSGIRRPLAPALMAAFGLWVDVAAGRVTFALGVAFALAACVLLVGERRPVLSAGYATLATMGSPVAGLFLVVAGAAYGLVRDWKRAVVLTVPPFLVVGATTLLFPFDGEQPMAAGRIWWPALLGVAVAVCAPRDWRVVRLGGAVYAAGVVLTYFTPSPIGSNVERLALLFAPAVLLAGLLCTERAARYRRGGLALALAGSLFWLGSGTPYSFLKGSDAVPAWAADTRGIVRELGRLDAERARVEVVPASDHREAAVLSPHVNMARGWNTQLDMERGRLFYDGTFSAPTYRAWLDRWAVGYVAVSDAEPDRYGRAEARLVRGGPGWLEPVWRDAHWRLYRVRNAVPLVPAPAEVVSASEAFVVVHVPKPGSVAVRIAYSPWLRADNGGCLRRQGEFTRLVVKEAGFYQISSEYDSGYDSTYATPAASGQTVC
ncbi:glycosyltransferase family 87 protein [Streptomyces sp. NPDC005374]|uniref:glycosyltransferase family 87 protein n=1 Tax=Streptomyces sp. NPDC005374 TaxID=3364713 RepID=UPI0036931E85